MNAIKKLLKIDSSKSRSRSESEPNTSDSADVQLVFDALPSLPDERDYQAVDHLSTAETVPKEYSLVKNLPSIRNQEGYGTCTAQSIACCKEFHEWKDVGYKDHFSPMFVYNLRPNYPQMGMFVRDALNVVRNTGICPEKNYPYVVSTDPKTVTDEMKNIASNYKITSYFRINTIDELKLALYQYGPCMIVFNTYNHSSYFWRKSTDDKFLGYHAVAVVGWTKDSFIIRNSWGMTWGFLGYTYYDFTEWGKHVELWGLIDAKSEYKPEDNRTNYCCFKI